MNPAKAGHPYYYFTIYFQIYGKTLLVYTFEHIGYYATKYAVQSNPTGPSQYLPLVDYHQNRYHHSG